MKTGKFYFLKEQFFIDFPDEKLMKNKERVNGQDHSRPSYYSFQDFNSRVYWMIPISSQVNKYKEIHANNIAKYKKSDTLVFGKVANDERVFLIQNMFPTIPYYISDEYTLSNKPVVLEDSLKQEILNKAQRILYLVRAGKKLVFPNILKIEKELISMLSNGVK